MYSCKSNKRIEYIDVVRGIAIIAIVWGHVVGSDYGIDLLNKWCNFFKIVVFYFIPGYLMGGKENISFSNIFKKKLKNLGRPYLVFSIIIIILDFIEVLIDKKNIIKLSADLYRTICFAGIGTLWFLPTLFIGELLFSWAIEKKCLKSLSFGGIIISILGMVLLKLPYNETLIFDIITAPIITVIKGVIGFLFMVVGMYTAFVHKILCTKIKLYHLSNMGIIIISCLVCSKTALSDFNHLLINSSIIAWWIACISSCLAIMYICKDLLMPIPILNYFRKTVAFFGKNSLVIMCTHFSILMPIFEKINLPHSWFEFCLIIIIGAGLSVIIEKKIPWILGK